MKLRRAAFLALVFLAGLVAAVVIRKSAPFSQTISSRQNATASNASDVSQIKHSSASPDTQAPGIRILQCYGAVSQSPEQDLTAVAHVLENFAILVKGDDALPLGANEEIAAALRGKNRAHFQMVPNDLRLINTQGEIVDRWNTPLYFHANSRDQIDIRSAGPDRQMWTSDDIHRRHDGRFLHGPSLLAPSLFEATSTRR